MRAVGVVGEGLPLARARVELARLGVERAEGRGSHGPLVAGAHELTKRDEAASAARRHSAVGEVETAVRVDPEELRRDRLQTAPELLQGVRLGLRKQVADLGQPIQGFFEADEIARVREAGSAARD